MQTHIPYEIKLSIYDYLPFEHLLKVTNKAHHKYDFNEHTYTWAIRNKYIHVLIWFKINKRPIVNDCSYSIYLYNIKCKKIINFVKNIDWNKNIKYTQIFENLLCIHDIDTVKYLMNKSITSPKYKDIYNPDTLNYLKINCIDFYPKKIHKSDNTGCVSISNTKNSCSININGDLLVANDVFIYGNCTVTGIIYCLDNISISKEELKNILNNSNRSILPL